MPPEESGNVDDGAEIYFSDKPNHDKSVIGLDIINIEEGYFYFGREPQQTILGSCVSLILLSREKLLGGLSCIVGRESKGPFNYPDQVVKYFQEATKRYAIPDPKYYVVGGSDSCKWVLDMVLDECKKGHINCSDIDTLGSYHRQVLLAPEQGKIQIYRKARSSNSFPKILP